MPDVDFTKIVAILLKYLLLNYQCVEAIFEPLPLSQFYPKKIPPLRGGITLFKCNCNYFFATKTLARYLSNAATMLGACGTGALISI